MNSARKPRNKKPVVKICGTGSRNGKKVSGGVKSVRSYQEIPHVQIHGEKKGEPILSPEEALRLIPKKPAVPRAPHRAGTRPTKKEAAKREHSCSRNHEVPPEVAEEEAAARFVVHCKSLVSKPLMRRCGGPVILTYYATSSGK